MNNFNEYTPSREYSSSMDLSKTMVGVYLYMFLGLLVTAATAYIAFSVESFMYALVTNQYLFYGLLIGEVLLVMILSASLRRLPYVVNLILFSIYSFANGLTLSIIFLVYTESSIYSVFLVTCLTFAAMSMIGYFTKKDLTTLGGYLMMGLVGIIIAGIVNLFFMNDVISFGLSVVGLLIFIGLTAYDTQKIKIMLAEEADNMNVNKIALWGALTLYLDFINIFLKILYLMGKRRKN